MCLLVTQVCHTGQFVKQRGLHVLHSVACMSCDTQCGFRALRTHAYLGLDARSLLCLLLRLRLGRYLPRCFPSSIKPE